MRPVVIDISHHNPVTSFATVKRSGIVGVIHKATQGTGNTDPTYAERRKLARAAGLSWGAYHFNSGEPIAKQVSHFLAAAQPDADTLMALDFEDNRASQMSLNQACDFLALLDQALGRRAFLYSGNRIKELIVKATTAQRQFLALHPFWLCQYGPRAKLIDANGHPLPWPSYTLWQFTGDGIGPPPHSVPGIPVTGLDINTFDGTDDELRAIWAGPAL